MHRNPNSCGNPPWSPWPEAGQLCESGPFRAFCRSTLPTSDQRLVCQACGLDHGQPLQPSPQSGPCPTHRSGPNQCPTWRGEDRFLSSCDLQPWEMPYVWELDSF